MYKELQVLYLCCGHIVNQLKLKIMFQKGKSYDNTGSTFGTLLTLFIQSYLDHSIHFNEDICKMVETTIKVNSVKKGLTFSKREKIWENNKIK